MNTEKPAYLLPAHEVIQSLQVRRDVGLSPTEVSRRRRAHGANILPKRHRRSPLLLVLERLKDTLVLLLLAAGIVSLVLGEFTDAIIIAFAVLLDTFLSFLQVWRTERTLRRLQQHVQQRATVLRDGHMKHLPAEQLVVGDIVELHAGQKVPADARLLSVRGLRVQEAALTGESTDAHKTSAQLKKRTPLADRRNMVYFGTTVMGGSAQAVVTGVGTGTEFGTIAQMLKDERSPASPLRRKLQQTGLRISWVVIGLVVLIMGLQLLSGATFSEGIRTAITLIVSAIPEDLTIILTVAMTVGVVRILRHQGVVRELSSGETLGAATVICTDKTGTLTEGLPQARELHCADGTVLAAGTQPESDWQRLAYTALALCSDARRAAEGGTTKKPRHPGATYIGSATERATLAFVEQAGLNQGKLKSQWRQRAALPFSSAWKYRATLSDHPSQPEQALFVTGAPEILLEHSSRAIDETGQRVDLTSEMRAETTRQFVALGSQGKRLVAVAVKLHLSQTTLQHGDIDGLTYLGVVTTDDPLRDTATEAILQTHAAGVAIKLVTGDHEATARAVARAAGLEASDDTVLNGDELAVMDDAELRDVIDDIAIFSRVEPLDKVRIVKALQSQGHVVAMTGDGINDAVALKAADIGVAMGSGKDIAKDASDLVLLDDDFATIVAAIKEGRVMRDNVRKVIAFLLATNIAEVAIFFGSFFLRLPFPLLPAQILWINLVTDGTSDLALSLEPAEKGVMKRPPEEPNGNLLTGHLITHIIIAGLIMTIVSLVLYWYLFVNVQLSLEYARTMVFTFLAVAATFSTWSYRSIHHHVLARGLFGNLWLFASAGFSLALQMVAIYTPRVQEFFGTVPLAAADWVIIGVLAAITVVAIEIQKILIGAWRKRSGTATTRTTPVLTPKSVT